MDTDEELPPDNGIFNWISIKEQIPEINTTVTVWDKVYKQSYSAMLQIYPNGKLYWQGNAPLTYTYSLTDGIITHWTDFRDELEE